MKPIKPLKAAAAALTALVLSLSPFLSVPADAASTSSKNVSAARIWNGSYDADWFTGDKTEYNIYTAEQLAGLNYLCDNNTPDDDFRGVTINLMNDIVLNDTSDFKNWGTKPPKNEWDPIAEQGPPSAYRPFCGVFNGNGHTVSGIYVNDNSSSMYFGDTGAAGLFRCTQNAVILNLKIEKSYLCSNNKAGAVAAYCQGSYFEYIEVEDCVIHGAKEAGGIVSGSYEFDMSYVLNTLTLVTLGSSPLYYLGLEEDTYKGGTICFFNKVKNCDISGGSLAGGMIGSTSWPTALQSCLLENCNLRSSGKTGGMVAVNENSKDNFVVKNCYEYGTDNGSGKTPAFVDKKNFTSITKSTLHSASFAKKLGNGYKSVKNSSPRIKAINKNDVKVVLSGKKASISWKKDSKATSYKVYYKNPDGSLKAAKSSKGTSVTLNNINKGSSYSIVIKACYKDGSSKTVSSGDFTFKA